MFDFSDLTRAGITILTSAVDSERIILALFCLIRLPRVQNSANLFLGVLYFWFFKGVAYYTLLYDFSSNFIVFT